MWKSAKAWSLLLLPLLSLACILQTNAESALSSIDETDADVFQAEPFALPSRRRIVLQSQEASTETASTSVFPLRGNQAGEFVRVKHVIKLTDKSKHIPYTCYTPVGLNRTSKILTIVTIMFGTEHAQKFVRENRLSYVKRNGYRYCELNHRLDPTRIAAWYKLPLVLALLPCSDFVLHVDADALLANQSISFEPVMKYMEHHHVDLLLSADIIRESPINFGVFAVRPAKWVYDMFQTLYNECACDWGRNFDWPAEQGTLYDILVRDYNSPDVINRTHIASMKMWNRHWMTWLKGDALVESTDLVIHFTGVDDFYTGKSCGTNYTCRFGSIKKHHDKAIAENVIPKPVDIDYEADFKKSVCHQIFFKQLVRADYTYDNKPDQRHSSSFMDYQLNPRGALKKIVIGEIACVGYRESKCRVKKYWNMKKGKGPWMPKWARPFKWFDQWMKEHGPKALL